VRRLGTISLDGTDLRYAAVSAFAAGAALPLLPVHPPLACPLRATTGVPCPLCGMTTSVTATIRLDLGSALAATPAGVAAVLAALLVLAVRPRFVRVPAPAPYLVLGCMWLYQLHRFSFL
jgi:Protein of unknown function (DUF2752)